MQVSQVAELPRTAAFRVKVGRAPALHLQGWQCGAMAEAIPLVTGAVSAKGLQGERAPAEITVLVTNLHHPGGTTSPREVQNGNPSVVYFGSWGGGESHCACTLPGKLWPYSIFIGGFNVFSPKW